MWNVGAEECHYYNEPVFEDDPIAWYDWYDNCNSFQPQQPPPDPPPPPPPPCRPRRYFLNGQCWEVVCSEEGPEIKRCFANPELTVTPALTITGIRITNYGYLVRIAQKKGFKIITVKPGTVKLRHMGAAMMLKRPLPDTDIKKIKAAFWNRLENLWKKIENR